MILGASGKKATIELSDFEVGALLKAIDACGKRIDLRKEMDTDDYYEFSSAVTKLSKVF
jgi:hypothetical protein